MSTLKKNITAQRISLLVTKGESVFHINDLANLWQISNKNTLRITLKRYAENKLLYRVYRGLYALYTPEKIDPVLLGVKALHKFCYLTTEQILYRAGVISQKIEQYTFVSETSLNFKIGKNLFKSRQLHDRYLYNPLGIVAEGGVRKASVARAICDMLYFNPYYYFDKPVDWRKIKSLQMQIGYPLTSRRYDFT